MVLSNGVWPRKGIGRVEHGWHVYNLDADAVTNADAVYAAEYASTNRMGRGNTPIEDGVKGCEII